jgi:hypothetical protein
VARKTLSLELDGEVSLQDLADAIDALQGIADALGKRVAPNVPIRWVVQDLEAGSARAEAVGTFADDSGQHDETVFDEIIRELERNARAAEAHLPVDPELERRFAQLTTMVNGHITGVRIGGDERYELTAPNEKPLLYVLPDRISDIGEVTGRVEAMNAHGRNHFSLFEQVHGKRVKVSVPAEQVSQMEQAWLRMVTVRGVVTRDANGHPISVTDLADITIHDDPKRGAWRRAIAAGDR